MPDRAAKMPNVSIHPGAINFNEFTDNELDMDDVHIDDPKKAAVMPYSSGTTGLPKGVLLSHTNIISNLQQFRSPDNMMMEYATDNFQEVVPAILPMFHIYGFTSICLASMLAGGKIVTLPKFTPESYTNVLKVHKPTVLYVVPPIVLFLYAHPMVTSDLLESVRVLMCGAAPLGALDEQKFLEKAGRPVHTLQGYGLSEASPVIAMVSYKKASKPGSIGNVLPNTLVKIMPVDDPNGEPLGLNQTGELLAKGPQVMIGYHNKPKETAETLQDGWLKTGDMVYCDEDQSLFVTDRIKELIKVKGFQVPPAELEEIIRDYPGVADAAVIGVPHEIYGEVPRAYVVSKPNTKLNSDKIYEYVASKVAEYKRIKGGIAIMDQIPKNASGKILRRELKQQYNAEHK